MKFTLEFERNGMGDQQKQDKDIHFRGQLYLVK